jgi:hypothetical protein
MSVQVASSKTFGIVRPNVSSLNSLQLLDTLKVVHGRWKVPLLHAVPIRLSGLSPVFNDVGTVVINITQ